jgi:zinc/manganese transport system substrate-binding protein
MRDPTDAACFATMSTRSIAASIRCRTTFAAIREHHPGAGVAYTERVPGYLLEDAGLQVVSPAAFAQAIAP